MHGLLAGDGRLESDLRRLHARNLAPVNAEEDALLRRARRNGAMGGGDLNPGLVTRRGPREGRRAACSNVHITVPEMVEWVDG